jgi:plasmid stability protein
MPTLTIKGLPDDVYHRLRDQAAAHHRSLNGEIIACLERSVGSPRPSPAERLAQADALRKRLKHVKALSGDELRAAIREGRE